MDNASALVKGFREPHMYCFDVVSPPKPVEFCLFIITKTNNIITLDTICEHLIFHIKGKKRTLAPMRIQYVLIIFKKYLDKDTVKDPSFTTKAIDTIASLIVVHFTTNFTLNFQGCGWSPLHLVPP